jgi:DMSO/TMAO reductase YedYZ heme-binding membrane subunit
MIPVPDKFLRFGIKPVVFLVCLGPIATLAWKIVVIHDLGANPVDVITRSTGKWTLTFLLITLAISPVRKLAGMPWLIRFRRMLGLFAFFYGSLHLTTYVWLDKSFDVPAMLHDIAKRRFITAGMTAWACMLPLALTSTTGWIRRECTCCKRLGALASLAPFSFDTHFLRMPAASGSRSLQIPWPVSVYALVTGAGWREASLVR